MVLYGLGRPGKLLLPGPCLLGPASSSCRGLRLGCLVFSWRFPGRPLPQGAATARAQVGVLRYPYFSTPTVTVDAAAEQAVMRKPPSRRVWPIAKAPSVRAPSLKTGKGILAGCDGTEELS